MTSLAEIEQRLAAATPGPWQEVVRTVVRVESGGRLGAPVGHCDSLRDAELIAHAPDDLRHLLDLVEEMERAHRDGTLGGGGSHWAECWRCHIDCATALIERQRAVIATLIQAGDALHQGTFTTIEPEKITAARAWREAKAGAA